MFPPNLENTARVDHWKNSASSESAAGAGAAAAAAAETEAAAAAENLLPHLSRYLVY